MTDMWYNEIKDYNFNDPGFKPGTGKTHHINNVNYLPLPVFFSI